MKGRQGEDDAAALIARFVELHADEPCGRCGLTLQRHVALDDCDHWFIAVEDLASLH